MAEEILAIVAIFAASVSAGSLVFSVKKFSETKKDEQKLRLAELIEKFQDDLERIQQRQLELTNLQDCRRYANDYLNAMNRLAFLNKRGTIDEDILEFFEWNFGYALTLIDWKKSVQPDYNPKNVIPHVEEWTSSSSKIKIVDVNRLPPLMLKMYNEQTNNTISHAYYKEK